MVQVALTLLLLSASPTRLHHAEWVDAAADQPLPAQLQAAVKKAKAEGLEPVAYLHASWCPPCKAIDRYRKDPKMRAAFQGTYVLRIDVDAFGMQLQRLGFDSSAIPAFFPLEASGKPGGKHLTGDAWKDNVPKEMAPKLAQFFHAK